MATQRLDLRTLLVAGTIGAASLSIFLSAATAPTALTAPTAPSAPASPQSATTLSDVDARTIIGQLSGAWHVSGRSFDADGQPDSELSGSAVYAWSLGGFFLAGEQVLSNGRAMLQWVDFIGYNQVNQHFSRTLLSDRDPANYCGIGIWDSGSKLLTFITDPVRGPDGTDRQIRSTLDLSNIAQPSWELAYLVGSGADQRQIGTVRTVLTRITGREVSPGQGVPGAPGVPGIPAPGQGPMTPAQIQSHLDGVLQQKQQMQQQIEQMRKNIKDMSDTMRNITK